MFAFSVSSGAGAMYWSSCIYGDSCGGLGPILELNPTIELHAFEHVMPFLALTTAIGYVVLGNRSVWATAGVSLGVAFDFSAAKP